MPPHSSQDRAADQVPTAPRRAVVLDDVREPGSQLARARRRSGGPASHLARARRQLGTRAS